MVNMKFIFMVSFIALFATGAAFAAAGDQSTGVGIAAVSYVDRIVAEKVDDLATVATSGSYNDLSDKPTIPTVNNATLTIQQNGTDVGTFNANSSTDKSINIVVPTVNSGTLNIVNGATGQRIAAFNANQSDNVEVTIPAATADVAGLAKLYNVASSANDGAMTAKAVTAQLGSKLDASKYGYIPTNSDGTGEALIWVE